MTEQEMIKRVNTFLTKRFIGEPDGLPDDECLEEAKEIHVFYKEDGYVKLTKDQSLPDPLLRWDEFCVGWNGYTGAQQDMLKDGFKKVIGVENVV